MARARASEDTTSGPGELWHWKDFAQYQAHTDHQGFDQYITNNPSDYGPFFFDRANRSLAHPSVPAAPSSTSPPTSPSRWPNAETPFTCEGRAAAASELHADTDATPDEATAERRSQVN